MNNEQQEAVKKALDCLCYYDERSPDYYEPKTTKEKVCYCDNCFYGRNELALIILKLLNYEHPKI